MASAEVSAKGQVLGSGVYDLLAAAYLLGINERTIRRWSQKDAAGHPPLVEPTHGWAFSFHDLLSLAVIAVLRQRKIKPTGVRNTILYLKDLFGVDRPLAHERIVSALSTAGESVILADYAVDVSARGQGALLPTIERYLRPVQYGTDGLARLWRPADRVLVDPKVQVGHPCVEATRVTTSTLAGRYAQGERVPAIAKDLQLDVDDVRAAIDFEHKLREGHGLASVA